MLAQTQKEQQASEEAAYHVEHASNLEDLFRRFHAGSEQGHERHDAAYGQRHCVKGLRALPICVVDRSFWIVPTRIKYNNFSLRSNQIRPTTVKLLRRIQLLRHVRTSMHRRQIALAMHRRQSLASGQMGR